MNNVFNKELKFRIKIINILHFNAKALRFRKGRKEQIQSQFFLIRIKTQRSLRDLRDLRVKRSTVGAYCDNVNLKLKPIFESTLKNDLEVWGLLSVRSKKNSRLNRGDSR
jgi:hypothetical protein